MRNVIKCHLLATRVIQPVFTELSSEWRQWQSNDIPQRQYTYVLKTYEDNLIYIHLIYIMALADLALLRKIIEFSSIQFGE